MSEEKKQKSDEIKEFGALMLNKNKKIVAVDTGTTSSVASFWAEHAITVVSCRKDSIENVIG